MTRAEIIIKVNYFLVNDIEINETILQNSEAKLKDDLGIDSLDFVDIVVIVERNFGFKIKPEEMANVETLAQFYDYVEMKVNEN
ncbi:MAG: phosphopantetheine-binding protein [Bacteroidales bacterium]|jgi:acyl carrier protein|nr:phosphopantetheine-binding protein [Bacteroidales bacterium]